MYNTYTLTTDKLYSEIFQELHKIEGKQGGTYWRACKKDGKGEMAFDNLKNKSNFKLLIYKNKNKNI